MYKIFLVKLNSLSRTHLPSSLCSIGLLDPSTLDIVPSMDLPCTVDYKSLIWQQTLWQITGFSRIASTKTQQIAPEYKKSWNQETPQR